MAFDGLTLNPGSGGATLATDSFTDTDSATRIMPFGAVAFGELNGPYTPVDEEHGLPVHQQLGATWAVSLTTIPLAAGAATAANQATAITALASIDSRLAGTLAVVGTVTIGDGGGSITVDGTIAATQSGVWTVGISGTVPVSGPLTDTQLRASAVPVSLAAVPTHAVTQSGAWTVSLSAALPAGTNNIGDVDVLTLPAVTIAAAQTLATVTTVGTVTTLTTCATVTNLAQLGGQAIAMGTGARTAGTQRVTIATDDVVPAQAIAGTSGGTTPYSFLSTAAVQAAVVKASAGQVYGLRFFNKGAAPVYVRLYNQTTTPGTSDTPNYRCMVPGNTAVGGFVDTIPPGITFGTGIGIRVTAGVADNDATALPVNDVMGNVLYK
ncbi:Uncharacterized protein OS=Sorangium cellulosum So0157-2 GN=SCE1572_38740 PE=4 SV=1 [Gemmata massiliana]|uniref:Uncharacterized protein n=1 Tax=Gemmata massiliana TaxID=1210884 RepID=A0A6P2DLW7_9BACT|nr:hypothetical protein [Gemmata massiliana]VTS03504.1 Uncharacterized protein OS=Sorangium cellulosum So0157-2 GN=SCE1572_38740 PE=4 SV=1 [Gemmata massiliana]